MSTTWNVYLHCFDNKIENKIASFDMGLGVTQDMVLQFACASSEKYARNFKLIIKDNSSIHLFHVANGTVYDSFFTIGKKFILESLKKGPKFTSSLHQAVFSGGKPTPQQEAEFRAALIQMEKEKIIVKHEAESAPFFSLKHKECGYVHGFCGHAS